MVCAGLALGQAVAEETPVAEYATRQEARIAARVKQERTVRRQLQVEYLLRQDYANDMIRERAKMARSGKLSTPEVEKLREMRAALIKQVGDLDKQIEEASLKAPEIVELDAVRKANDERLEALRAELVPEVRHDVKPAAK